MKKILKYFVFGILFIEIFNLFPFYQVKADEELQDEVVYQNGDLRCPPNSSSSECQLINNGTEAVVTHTEGDVTIIKHVQKTETLGRYKIWFEIQNNGETTTQVVESNTYVYFIADASSTNDENVSSIEKALKSFYGILASKNIYFSGGAFAKDANNFNSNFKNSVDSMNINLDPTGSTSHLYKSLNKAVDMFNKDYIKPEDKKIVVVLGDGLYYRCTDYKARGDCSGDSKSSIQSQMLGKLNTSLTNIRNNGIELYFVRYYGNENGSDGYTHYQNLYDLPDNYFNKSLFLSNGRPCKKYKNCRPYGKYKIMYYATSPKDVTTEVIRYIIRAGNDIKVTDADAANRISSHFIKKSGTFQNTLDALANTITNNINTVNITYNYELIDYIYDAFIDETTGFQGEKREFRISGSGMVTTEPFYVKIADDLKDIENEDNWYNTNNDFNLKFKREEQDIDISCGVNPQVYWVLDKLTVDSCFGTAQFSDTYDLSSKYYRIECKEGYGNNSGFVAKFNVGGLNGETNNFQTSGFGFPISVDLSTNVSCTYNFDTNTFATDYNNLNTCLSANAENTPEYASCYKKKIEMDKISNNYINLAGNSSDKGKKLQAYITDFENINGNVMVNYSDGRTDSLSFITSNFDKNIQCTNGTSTNLANNQTVYTNFTCYLGLSKKLQLDSSCVDMKTANKAECSDTTINGGNLYYMDLASKEASITINIYNTGYMGNVGINLQNCSAMQDINFNITYRQIDLVDPFLQDFNTDREIGKNYLNSKYNFVNIIKEDLWNNTDNFMYRYTMNKTNIENIRKDTNEIGVSSYLGRNCYISDNKYICDLTRDKITDDGVKRDLFTKIEINE